MLLSQNFGGGEFLGKKLARSESIWLRFGSRAKTLEPIWVKMSQNGNDVTKISKIGSRLCTSQIQKAGSLSLAMHKHLHSPSTHIRIHLANTFTSIIHTCYLRYLALFMYLRTDFVDLREKVYHG